MLLLYHIINSISRRNQLIMAKKQIIFRLEEETYQQLQIYAIRNKTSVQKIVEEYILELLKKRNDDSRLHPYS